MVKKNRNIKIIATLGPSSLKTIILKHLRKDVDIFRLNMSHLSLDQLKKNLKFLKKNNIKNICIDTEGAQVRTLLLKKKIFLKKNRKIKISTNKFKLKNCFQLYPNFSLKNIKIRSKIKIGFDGLELQVEKKFKNFVQCKVSNKGFLDSNKGVHFDDNIKLDPLTKKDIQSISIAKKFGVKIFALSFANSARDVLFFRSLIDKNDELISKVETKRGFFNRKEITKASNAILIDRGDLSRYIDIPKIPLAQRIIINDAKKQKKKVYIATNLLETMINLNEPTRAESNDIYSSLESGCAGLVLAAETAIGNNPVKCVLFLKKCLQVFYNQTKFKKKYSLFFKN